jgi:hypothetical protein
MAHKQRPSRGLRVGPDPACPDEESGSWWRSALSKPTFSGPRGFKRRQRRASRASLSALCAQRSALSAEGQITGNPDCPYHAERCGWAMGDNTGLQSASHLLAASGQRHTVDQKASLVRRERA